LTTAAPATSLAGAVTSYNHSIGGSLAVWQQAVTNNHSVTNLFDSFGRTMQVNRGYYDGSGRHVLSYVEVALDNIAGNLSNNAQGNP